MFSSHTSDIETVHVVLISKDLFFAPVVKSAAEPVGAKFTIGLNPDSKNVATLGESVEVCLVDLSSIPSADIIATAELLRTQFPVAHLTAFAPHVHETKLQSAMEAGFDPVLSRGQVSSLLPKLFAQWITPPSTDPEL